MKWKPRFLQRFSKTISDGGAGSDSDMIHFLIPPHTTPCSHLNPYAKQCKRLFCSPHSGSFCARISVSVAKYAFVKCTKFYNWKIIPSPSPQKRNAFEITYASFHDGFSLKHKQISRLKQKRKRFTIYRSPL